MKRTGGFLESSHPKVQKVDENFLGLSPSKGASILSLPQEILLKIFWESFGDPATPKSGPLDSIDKYYKFKFKEPSFRKLEAEEMNGIKTHLTSLFLTCKFFKLHSYKIMTTLINKKINLFEFLNGGDLIKFLNQKLPNSENFGSLVKKINFGFFSKVLMETLNSCPNLEYIDVLELQPLSKNKLADLKKNYSNIKNLRMDGILNKALAQLLDKCFPNLQKLHGIEKLSDVNFEFQLKNLSQLSVGYKKVDEYSIENFYTEMTSDAEFKRFLSVKFLNCTPITDRICRPFSKIKKLTIIGDLETELKETFMLPSSLIYANFSNFKYTKGFLDNLANHMSNLKFLSLSYCKFEEYKNINKESLTNLLNRCFQLVALDLSGIQGAVGSFRYMTELKKLEFLSLEKTKLTNEELPFLLTKFPQLCVLDVSANPISPEHLSKITLCSTAPDLTLYSSFMINPAGESKIKFYKKPREDDGEA